MAMITVYYVTIGMLDENGEPYGGVGYSLRPSLEGALEAVRELMSKRIARVSGGKIIKCEITVYEHEDLRGQRL